jgi:hypothetical protein
MSFNIGKALTGAVEGLVTSGGNPIAAGVGALTGACSSSQSPACAQPQPTNGMEGLLQEMLAEQNGQSLTNPLQLLAQEAGL